jgi:GGDEF domain-containing protein
MGMAYTDLLKNLQSLKIDDDILEKVSLMAQGSKDPLTGFLDYRSFSFKCQEFLKNKKPYSLFSLSIDHLQELNMISSWVVGDLAICSMGEQINNTLEDGEFLGRISGDTFMALFCHEDQERIHLFFDNLQEFAKNLRLPGVDLFPEGHLTLSSAVVLGNEFEEEAFAVDMLLSESNKRLGTVRANGGNGITFLGAETTVSLLEERALKVVLNSASMKTPEEVMVEKLSLSGVVFMTKTPLLVRDSATLNISFENEVSLSLSCSIVWRKVDSEQGLFEIGVKFIELTQDDSRILENFLLGVK